MNQDLFLTALFGATTFLVYWTGRWYKQWYFNQFSIHYDELNLSTLYFLFGSWATILVAGSCLIPLFFVALSIYLMSPLDILLAIILVVVAGFILSKYWPVLFEPDQFWRSLFGSMDLCLALVGVVASILTTILFFERYTDLLPILSEINDFVQNYPFLTLVVFVLVTWPYLGFVGYWMGNYHGYSAIWEGKMGHRWARVQNEKQRWILVIRNGENRNFVYHRSTRRRRIVPDEEILCIEERVRRP
jgi:hypothetical protein